MLLPLARAGLAGLLASLFGASSALAQLFVPSAHDHVASWRFSAPVPVQLDGLFSPHAPAPTVTVAVSGQIDYYADFATRRRLFVRISAVTSADELALAPASVIHTLLNVFVLDGLAPGEIHRTWHVPGQQHISTAAPQPLTHTGGFTGHWMDEAGQFVVASAPDSAFGFTHRLHLPYGTGIRGGGVWELRFGADDAALTAAMFEQRHHDGYRDYVGNWSGWYAELVPVAATTAGTFTPVPESATFATGAVTLLVTTTLVRRRGRRPVIPAARLCAADPVDCSQTGRGTPG